MERTGPSRRRLRGGKIVATGYPERRVGYIDRPGVMLDVYVRCIAACLRDDNDTKGKRTMVGIMSTSRARSRSDAEANLHMTYPTFGGFNIIDASHHRLWKCSKRKEMSIRF